MYGRGDVLFVSAFSTRCVGVTGSQLASGVSALGTPGVLDASGQASVTMPQAAAAVLGAICIGHPGTSAYLDLASVYLPYSAPSPSPSPTPMTQPVSQVTTSFTMMPTGSRCVMLRSWGGGGGLG